MFQGKIPGSSLYPILATLLTRKESVKIECTIESFCKNIFIWQGKVFSASSNLIDDRMGEVMYRDGKLPLDTFIDLAGQVTEKKRFGDVMIDSGVYTSVDLWNFLNSQSREILRSLCFYREIEITCHPLERAPKNEFTVQFEIHKIFQEGQKEALELTLFDELANESPRLELNEAALKFANNDFLRDMVALVQETPDYTKIVEEKSRLSKTYTIRALYQLMLKGIIRDSWGMAQSELQDASQTALQQVIEDANYMLRELANVAKQENLEGDWDEIVANASQILTGDLGPGVYLNPEKGFLPKEISLAAVMHDEVKRKAQEKFLITWPSSFVGQIQETIFSSVLVIYFELLNRRFRSEELAKVKSMIDEMRVINGDQQSA